MNINTTSIISITDANQNFSRLAKIVQRDGKAYIFKNNKPKYMMLDINNHQAVTDAIKELKEDTGKKGAS